MIAVHTAADPSDAEWAVLVDAAQELRSHGAVARALIITDGGKPNAIQRKALVAASGGTNEIQSAVLSGQAMVRGVITAFSWLGANISSFTPDHGLEALTFLDVDATHANDVSWAVEAMRDDVGNLAILRRVVAGLRAGDGQRRSG